MISFYRKLNTVSDHCHKRSVERKRYILIDHQSDESIRIYQEDLEVTDRGKVLFIVKSPKSNKEDAFNTLIGVARSDIPYEEIFKEKIRELYKRWLTPVCCWISISKSYYGFL